MEWVWIVPVMVGGSLVVAAVAGKLAALRGEYLERCHGYEWADLCVKTGETATEEGLAQKKRDLSNFSEMFRIGALKRFDRLPAFRSYEGALYIPAGYTTPLPPVFAEASQRPEMSSANVNEVGIQLTDELRALGVVSIAVHVRADTGVRAYDAWVTMRVNGHAQHHIIPLSGAIIEGGPLQILRIVAPTLLQILGLPEEGAASTDETPPRPVGRRLRLRKE